MSSCLPTPSAPTYSITSPAQLAAPVPSTFVKRNGTRLELDGQEFKAVGPNVYWLGLDENVAPSPSWPGRGRVLEAMAVASAMGATTIRATSLGVSVGTSLSVASSLGVFNEEAFAAIDWAVWAAKSYGLRLVLPLTDQYDYYHGGIPTFLRWRNLSATDLSPFYDLQSDVYTDFTTYVTTLLTHRSNITGLTLAEEPTVLAFETGNELGGWSRDAYPPTVEWTTAVSDLLKTLAPDTLVISGSYGVQKRELNIASVDIVSDHYYPLYSYNLKKAASLAGSSDKVFLVGEFDWTDRYYFPLTYLAILIPAVLAALVWLLPKRWWPWHASLGCFCCRRRRRRRRASSEQQGTFGLGEGYQNVYSSPDLTKLDSPLSSPAATTTFPPSRPSPSPSTSILDRSFQIRRWHMSLFVLLLCAPLGAVINVFLPTPLSSFLSTLESTPNVEGSLYWSLFGRDDSCCGYVPHNDGYTLHYPSDPGAAGAGAGSGAKVLELTKHAWRMRGVEPSWLSDGVELRNVGMAGLPTVMCPQDGLAVPANASWSGGIGNETIDTSEERRLRWLVANGP